MRGSELRRHLEWKHSNYVYRELLKLSDADIDVLRAEGHIGMDFLGLESPNANDP